MFADRVRMGSGSGFDPSTWKGIQKIVREGVANEFFSVGDNLISNYNGSPITLQVIGINNDTPTDSKYTHSMTLQTKDCILNSRFDSVGNSRYLSSSIRNHLNSPSFLDSMEPELMAVIGEVNKKVAEYAGLGGQETFNDKIFLLSTVEVGSGTATGEFVYPYYNGLGNSGRIKTINGNPIGWWLRSPSRTRGNIEDAFTVNTYGSLRTTYSYYNYGIAPAFCIV